MKKIIIGLLMVGLVGGLVSVAQADIPRKINIQGKLSGDNIPANGTTTINDLTIRLVQPGAGVLHEQTVPITVTNGLFNVEFGDIPISVAFNTPLSIQFIRGTTLIGTQSLLTVPYAFQAARASVAESLTYSAENEFVKKSGDTMNGTLNINIKNASIIYGINAYGDMGGNFTANKYQGLKAKGGSVSGTNYQGIVGETSDVPIGIVLNPRGVGVQGRSVDGIGIEGLSEKYFSGHFEGGLGVKIEGTLEVTKILKANGGIKTNVISAETTLSTAWPGFFRGGKGVKVVGPIEANNLKLVPSSAPTASEGLVYYDTTAKIIKYYDGTKWVEVVPAYSTKPVKSTSWINGTNTSAASITGLPSGKDIIITALAGRWLTGGTSGAKGKFVIASGATVYCDFPMPGRFVDNNSYDNKDPFYLVLPTPIKIPSSAVNGLTLSWTPDGTDSATTYRFSIQYLEL